VSDMREASLVLVWALRVMGRARTLDGQVGINNLRDPSGMKATLEFLHDMHTRGSENAGHTVGAGQLISNSYSLMKGQ